MFVDFFYKLKDVGIPVSPTSFLTLHKALARGLVNSLEDFYTAARAVLIKSERYFDIYDQVFAHTFQGADVSWFAKYAAEKDTLYINREDDSGEENLRYSKLAYRPVCMIDKYWVTIE